MLLMLPALRRKLISINDKKIIIEHLALFAIDARAVQLLRVTFPIIILENLKIISNVLPIKKMTSP